jgi:hypothetical protein
MPTRSPVAANEFEESHDSFAPDHASDRALHSDAAHEPLSLGFGAAATLLQRSAITHAANAPLRAAAFLRTQQTHGNRAAQRSAHAIQTKLTISEPGDAMEQEAERVAQEATGGHEDCECGGTCDECQAHAARKVQTKLNAGAITRSVQRRAESSADASDDSDLDTRLSSQAGMGDPLSEDTRAFAESRLGHDFGDVRVHTDADASDLATSLQADAFTTGSDIYFRNGRHDPDSHEGKQLLTHELTHVVQQRSSERLAQRRRVDGATSLPSIRTGSTGLAIQRVRCGLVPAADCAAPIAGSASDFGTAEAAVEAGPRDRRSKMSPARQTASGHTGRARQLELILEAEQPGVLANVQGIFIDMDMSPGTGALTDLCSNMIPPVPAAAGRKCVFVPPHLNQQALQFRQGRATVGGQPREDWRVQTIQTLTHEIQHITFDAAGLGQAPGVTAAACSRADVEVELSEMAAIMSEFPIAFRAIPAAAPAGDPARTRLTNWFTTAITNPSESIEGALKSMRCKCDCPHVDAFVIQTFNFVSTSWTATEKLTFNTVLRDPARGLHWPL